MRVAEALLIVALGIGVTGCVRKPKTVAAAPAPPTPVAPAPAPPPEPLSVPQTNVVLPPPQPLTPEAIATTQLPSEAPQSNPTPPPPRVNRPKPAPRPAEPPPATMPTATPPSVEQGRAPITEVLPAAELKRLQDEAASRSAEAYRLVEQLPARRRQQDGRVRRIETFLKQAADAERRGDMRQASELAGRALVLARELKP
jgi:hypothetical protein